jgi:hypothetical protein
MFDEMGAEPLDPILLTRAMADVAPRRRRFQAFFQTALCQPRRDAGVERKASAAWFGLSPLKTVERSDSAVTRRRSPFR